MLLSFNRESDFIHLRSVIDSFMRSHYLLVRGGCSYQADKASQSSLSRTYRKHFAYCSPGPRQPV